MISKSTTVSTGECKCGVLEVHFKLKDQQQVVLLIYRLQYQNLMVTTIWKFTHTKKKKETKHKSKISYQITREENKSGREEKRTKINPKQLTKWQSDQISQSLSHVQLFATPWIAARQASLSITNSQSSLTRPSSQWCHPATSSSVVPFSSCPQSLPASESFPMSQLFAWGGHSTGVSALASFLPKKSQGWSPSERTGWISLQSRGLSSVFSNTTVQKHQNIDIDNYLKHKWNKCFNLNTQIAWMDTKNKIHIYRSTSDLGTYTDWKWSDGKIYSMQMEIKRKLEYQYLHKTKETLKQRLLKETKKHTT